ncbi:MAG: hypothetical protein OXG53_15830, partial [Chloroflexi bacterium]|nr:hypothetical protein [Chloroflexota bacterium]
KSGYISPKPSPLHSDTKQLDNEYCEDITMISSLEDSSTLPRFGNWHVKGSSVTKKQQPHRLMRLLRFS